MNALSSRRQAANHQGHFLFDLLERTLSCCYGIRK